jgi:hypothetical protein
MRRPRESSCASFNRRWRGAMRDSHAKCVKIYRPGALNSGLFRGFCGEAVMAPTLLSKTRRLWLETQPLDPSNMKTHPAASEKLCSVLTSGELLLSGGNIRLNCLPGHHRSAREHARGCGAARRGILRARSQGFDTLCGAHPSSAFDFLLLYLTGMVVLDNRHGLPKKFVSFQAAQTCRPLCHNFKC